MHEDTAAADHTQPHVFALDRAPMAEQVAQLRQELAEAVGMLNHQLKRNGELVRENLFIRKQLQELQMREVA